MKFTIFITFVTLLSSVYGAEVKTTKSDTPAQLPMQHRSDDAMARVQTKKQNLNPVYSTGPGPQVQQQVPASFPTAYQQVGIGAAPSQYEVVAANAVPGGAYHHLYQNQGAQAYQQQPTAYTHPKETTNVKKPISPLVKDVKPAYYPKQSTYATIPNQPNQVPVTHLPGNTARFVADPSRNHLIEEISENQLQQLTFRPQNLHYSVAPQAGVPAYTNFVGTPAAPMAYHPQYHNPQMNTETVTYEQTEHGFMDRVWGEVQSMRESITTDFFGAIPAFFRSMWDSIVGAVSTASARMLTVDWVSVLDIVRKQIQ